MFFHAHNEDIPFQVEQFRDSHLLIRLYKPIWGYDKLADFRKVVPKSARFSIIVDLSRVQQMSTAAFSQLLVMKSICDEQGRPMRIQGLQKQPQALCEILKLTDVLLNERRETEKIKREGRKTNICKQNTLLEKP